MSKTLIASPPVSAANANAEIHSAATSGSARRGRVAENSR